MEKIHEGDGYELYGLEGIPTYKEWKENNMDEQEILELIDKRATELEMEAYKEGEWGNALKSERANEQALALRNLQQEIRNGE